MFLSRIYSHIVAEERVKDIAVRGRMKPDALRLSEELVVKQL
jgi:hypothetical protein